MAASYQVTGMLLGSVSLSSISPQSHCNHVYAQDSTTVQGSTELTYISTLMTSQHSFALMESLHVDHWILENYIKK